MQMDHYFSVLKMTDEGCFVADQFRDLPEFCAVTIQLRSGLPVAVTYVDAWVVNPTGDMDEDIATGRRYAEQAIVYARKIGSPTFIAWVLDCIRINGSTSQDVGLIWLEVGFFDRLARAAFVGSMN